MVGKGKKTWDPSEELCDFVLKQDKHVGSYQGPEKMVNFS